MLEMLEEERLRSWREVREEMERRELRLRKVLGRKRAMTLLVGEQVIPCQEQGLEEEGDHEGRRGYEMVGSIERRASPSGERQVVGMEKRIVRRT